MKKLLFYFQTCVEVEADERLSDEDISNCIDIDVQVGTASDKVVINDCSETEIVDVVEYDDD